MRNQATIWIRIVAILLIVMAATAAITQAQQQTHVIQLNENLETIAAIYGVSLDSLMQQNGIIDPNRIVVGQVLIIPSPDTVMPTTYLVQQGDTLEWIAERYNTTVEALQQTNNLATTVVVPGQVLQLPATGGPVSQQDTVIAADTATASQPAQTQVTQTGTVIHTVDIGETLGSIAARYGVTAQSIITANNLTNPNLIPAGSQLVIPDVNFGTGGAVVVVVTPAPVVQATSVPVLTYTIQAGDVLELIAERFGVTVESIVEYNGLTSTRGLYPGDVILIPPTGGPVTASAATQTSTAPIARGTTYVVQPGDTMFSIATRAGINVYDLAEANDILNLNFIYNGQYLWIP